MSAIFKPEIVVVGRLPLVGELEELGEMVIDGLNARYAHEESGEFVLYGSVPRRDATRRSDLDISLVLPDSEDWYRKHYHGSDSVHEYSVVSVVDELLASVGWEIPATIVTCSSRRIQKLLWKDRLIGNEYGTVADLAYCPTTYDHFGFLSELVDDPHVRALYKTAQREIGRYSRTDQASRIKDLIGYLNFSRSWMQREVELPGPRSIANIECLDQLGRAENVAYHAVRKLAGVMKKRDRGDGKDQIAGYLQNTGNQFLDRIAEQFEIVRQFGHDYEDVLVESLGQPSQSYAYRRWVNEHAPSMMRGVRELMGVLEAEFIRGTFLETIADYDRQVPKSAILIREDGYFEGLDKFAQDWDGRAAISWVCIGERVFISPPHRGFVLVNRGRTEAKMGYDFRDRVKAYGCNEKMRTALGRVELDLRTSPATFCAVEAKPLWQRDAEAARLSHEAVILEVSRLLAARGFVESVGELDTRPCCHESQLR